MTYEDRPIDGANYSWYARVFNRPHNEIENDFRVGDRALRAISEQLAANSDHKLTSDREGYPSPG
jgi:hypothetical protein